MDLRLMKERHAHGPAIEAAPAARPWEWSLAEGGAHRIDAASVARWLEVAAGRVWLTPTRNDDRAADHWLAAGERLMLPAGSAWVVEAWPAARVALHLVPPGVSLPGASSPARLPMASCSPAAAAVH